jgi:AraC family transcriptional regulator
MQQLVISTDFHPEQIGVQTELLFEANSRIPGSVQYSIKRYARPKNWIADDVGVIRYHYQPSNPEENRLELKFCCHRQCLLPPRSKGMQPVQGPCFFSLRTESEESVDFLSFVFFRCASGTICTNRGSTTTTP